MTDTKTHISELERAKEKAESILKYAEMPKTYHVSEGQKNLASSYLMVLQSLKDKDAEIERRILESLPMRLRVEVKHVLDGTKPEILRTTINLPFSPEDVRNGAKNDD